MTPLGYHSSNLSLIALTIMRLLVLKVTCYHHWIRSPFFCKILFCSSFLCFRYYTECILFLFMFTPFRNSTLVRVDCIIGNKIKYISLNYYVNCFALLELSKSLKLSNERLRKIKKLFRQVQKEIYHMCQSLLLKRGTRSNEKQPEVTRSNQY